jgi:hypothetical protein
MIWVGKSLEREIPINFGRFDVPASLLNRSHVLWAAGQARKTSGFITGFLMANKLGSALEPPETF